MNEQALYSLYKRVCQERDRRRVGEVHNFLSVDDELLDEWRVQIFGQLKSKGKI